MIFDIRTPDSAYDFILDFLGITGETFVMKYCEECKSNIDAFIDEYYNEIEDKGISGLKIMAFHILGSLDNCQEIKRNGLINLQKVLSRDTLLHKLLLKAGVDFDIDRRIVKYEGVEYDIDYERYREEHFLSPEEVILKDIGYRVYYDFCVNGFLYNDNAKNYGTDIHERPEFFNRLTDVFPAAKTLENYWKSNSVGYCIDFYATPEQIHEFTYGVDLKNISEYDMQFIDLKMELKKWMLSLACSRTLNQCEMKCLYIKEDTDIPFSQIVSISKLN